MSGGQRPNKGIAARLRGVLRFFAPVPVLLGAVLLAVAVPGVHAQDAKKPDAEKKRDPQGGGLREEDRKKFKEALERLLKPDDSDFNAPDSEKGKEPHKSRRMEDVRAAVDQQAWDLVEGIQKDVGERKFKEAIGNMQKVFERKEDALYLTENRKWISVRDEAQRLFQTLPVETRQLYETQYGGLARQQLEQALKSGSARELADVASRYLNTLAGAQAANAMASWHLDHQESVLAHVWMRRIASSEAEISRQILWKLKALRVARMTGDEGWSQTLLADLSKVSPEQLKLADSPVDLKTWGQQRPEVGVQAARDWPMFYGNESRNGIQQKGTPWLRPRWQVPFAGSELVQKVTRDLWKELQDRRVSALPANQPLVVGDYLIVRNWQGVQVLLASSGKVLWEARDRVPAGEMLLALHRSWLAQAHSEADEEDHRDPLGWASLSIGQQIWQGSGGEFSPVAHFLFRDYNYGLQSSDGERLFVIHELPVLTFGQPRQGTGNEDASDLDPFGRHWSSNVLASYDLKTGRRQWDAGGGVEDLEFETPLSGWFFLGAPLPQGGELLCVAEKKGEIRLLAIDPGRGNLLWSQLLGYSEVKISEDVGRQWLSIQPTVAEGLVICPLMTGWIVAIDRLTHSIVWTAQTRPPQKNEGSHGLMPSGFGERWGLSPVVVAGDRLICTPQEGGNLVCLKLQSGETLWSKPRGDGVYLAGIHEKTAIVVGKSQVRGIELSEGKEAWKCALPPRTHITGRGLVTEEGVLQLPVSGGEFVCISLKDYTIQSRLRQMSVAEGQEVPPLGNLVRCGDVWCAVHPLGIQAFESQDIFETASQEAGKLPGANGVQRQALWLSMRGDYQKAWGLLQSRPGDVVDAANEQLRGEVLMNILKTVATKPVTEETQKFEQQAMEWLKQAHHSALKAKVRGVVAHRLRERGEFLRAFEILWELADEMETAKAGEAALWTSGEEDAQRSRADVWLSRNLHETFQAAAENGRKELNARIEEIVATRLKGPSGGREKTVRLLAFHPASLPLRWGVVAELAGRREWSLAEALIREVETLIPGHEVDVAERLIALQMAAGRREDAAWLFQETVRRNPQAQTGAGESFVAWENRLRREGKIGPAESPVRSLPVSGMTLQKEGGHGELIPAEEIAIPVEASPSWRNWQLLVYPSEQRFVLRNARTNQMEWSLPLRSRSETFDGEISSHVAGDRLYLWFRGVLHALAPFERRVLWTRNLGSVQPSGEDFKVDVPATRTLVPLSKSVLSRRSVDDVWGRDPLQPLGAGALVYRHRRSLEVMDSQTGETLWSLEGLSSDVEVRGDGEWLYLFSLLSKAPQVRSVKDGGLVDVPNLNQELRQTVQFSGHRLIRYEQVQGEGAQKGWSVTSYDPVSKQTAWERKYVEEPSVGCLSEQAMLVRCEGSELELVNLRTGTAEKLGRIDVPAGSGTHPALVAFRDWGHVYVAVNRGGRTLFQDGLPVAEINGVLYVFSNGGQGLLWKKELRGERSRWNREAGGYGLILAGLDQSSVLLFSRREFERRGNKDDFGLWTQKLVAVDKLTGKELLKASLAPASGFREMTVNPAEGTLELRGYDQRVRLVPSGAKKDVSVQEPTKVPVSAKPAEGR